MENAAGTLWTKAGLAWLDAFEFSEPHLTACLRALTALLRSLKEQIALLRRRMDDVAKEAKVALAMLELPQVASVTAVTLLYELGDVRRFESARKVAAYAGIVPRVTNSADKSHHGSITKHGNRELRWVLSQWAVRLLTTNALARRWAQPLLARMNQNKVRIALARRLLVGVYVMLSRGEEFRLERCLTRPGSAKAA